MKKAVKQLVCLALCGALLLAGIPLGAQAATFRDVPASSWYYRAVSHLADQGIVAGTGGGNFSPGSTLTRGQFVTMLAKSTLSQSDVSQYHFRGSFSDVGTSHWANPYVNWAVETGVADGYEDGTFRPDRTVTRQEVAVMVRNFARSVGRQFPDDHGSVTFRDQGKIASWAEEAVALCQQAGVISGDDNRNFRPTGRATRAEAASIVYNFLENCETGRYSIVQKRINGVPVRAVAFNPVDYDAGLVLAQDMVDGRESAPSLVERTGASIAVNGAFFNMDDYTPLGTLIGDGRVFTVDNKYAPQKAALVMAPSGEFFVESFSTQFTARLIDSSGSQVAEFESVGVNKWPSSSSDATRLLMTRDWGTNLNFYTRDAIVVDANGTVTAKYTYAENVSIPEGGFVLCQRARRQYEGNFFDSCQVGMTIQVERQFIRQDGSQLPYDPEISIGAGPRIVKGGQVYGGYSTYRDEGFDDSVTSGATARVAAGIRSNGTMVLVQANTNLPALSEIMLYFGCQDAVNFDGGGSVNLYVDGYWLYGPQSRPLNNMLYFTR